MPKKKQYLLPWDFCEKIGTPDPLCPKRDCFCGEPGKGKCANSSNCPQENGTRTWPNWNHDLSELKEQVEMAKCSKKVSQLLSDLLSRYAYATQTMKKNRLDFIKQLEKEISKRQAIEHDCKTETYITYLKDRLAIERFGNVTMEEKARYAQYLDQCFNEWWNKQKEKSNKPAFLAQHFDRHKHS